MSVNTIKRCPQNIVAVILLATFLVSEIIFLNAVSVNAQTNSLGSTEYMEAKNLLKSLGYWIAPAETPIDESSFYAIVAFQRVSGVKATGKLTWRDLRILRISKRLRMTRTGDERVHVDLSKKVLFLVGENGLVDHIIPVSVGSNRMFTEGGRRRRARTPRGLFTVYKKIDGWYQSPLGEMYSPSYIIGGVAIHGSKKMRIGSSTFGCVAVPMYAAEVLSDKLDLGTKVYIY